MRFGVITQIEQHGNMATALGQVFQETEKMSEANGWQSKYEHVNPAISLQLHMPVFTLGEILILDESGREVAGAGRKPSKWYVTCEEFNTVEEAVARAQQLEEEAYA